MLRKRNFSESPKESQSKTSSPNWIPTAYLKVQMFHYICEMRFRACVYDKFITCPRALNVIKGCSSDSPTQFPLSVQPLKHSTDRYALLVK